MTKSLNRREFILHPPKVLSQDEKLLTTTVRPSGFGNGVNNSNISVPSKLVVVQWLGFPMYVDGMYLREEKKEKYTYTPYDKKKDTFETLKDLFDAYETQFINKLEPVIGKYIEFKKVHDPVYEWELFHRERKIPCALIAIRTDKEIECLPDFLEGYNSNYGDFKNHINELYNAMCRKGVNLGILSTYTRNWFFRLSDGKMKGELTEVVMFRDSLPSTLYVALRSYINYASENMTSKDNKKKEHTKGEKEIMSEYVFKSPSLY